MFSPVRVLYIYASADAPLREALQAHLAVLTRRGEIEGWGVDWLLAGEQVQAEVARRLAAADLLVPLVSPDLFASDREHALLEQALRRHREHGTPLAPVIVRPVAWQDSALAGLAVLPAGGKPVTSWGNQDEAWLSVVQGLRRLLAGTQKTEAASEPEGEQRKEIC